MGVGGVGGFINPGYRSMCPSHSLKDMWESPARGSMRLGGKHSNSVCRGNARYAGVSRDPGKVVRRLVQGVIKEVGRHQGGLVSISKDHAGCSLGTEALGWGR